jgi:hypothetical protein
MYSTTEVSHKKTQQNSVVTHEAIQKYIRTYTRTSILSTYDIYTTFKWMTQQIGMSVRLSIVFMLF